MPRSKPSTRIGEAERAAAQRALQEHLNAGRLQVTEYAERSAHAAEATSAAEIDALFTDLPAPHPKMTAAPTGGARRTTIMVVGGVAVVALVGLIAFAAGRSGQAATPPVVAAAPTPSALPATPTDADVASTAAVPSDESSSADTASETTNGTAAPLPGVSVRRTTSDGAITLNPSYGVDLDDNTSPNWNVTRSCCDSDVSNYYGTALQFTGDFAVVTGPVEYATCANETGYTNGRIERGSLKVGEEICLRTGGNRYALVTIADVSDQALQFRATVWDPPISS